MTAVITIGIDPELHLGPLDLAWHGLTIALGIVIGGWLGGRWARRQGLTSDPLYTIVLLAAAGGMVGGRIFYVLEHGGPLFGTRGFTFDGGLILAGIAIAAYVRIAKLDLRYLDAAALGLPLGVAIGRIGDVINGEHYGARSDFLLAVRNAHPDALTPDSRFAYESGGLYEVLLAVVVGLLLWALRGHARHAGDLAWLVLGLFSIGRFFEFFLRDDSPALGLGLNNAQWTSVVLLAVAVVGRAATNGRWSRARRRARVPSQQP